MRAPGQGKPQNEPSGRSGPHGSLKNLTMLFSLNAAFPFRIEGFQAGGLGAPCGSVIDACADGAFPARRLCKGTPREVEHPCMQRTIR